MPIQSYRFTATVEIDSTAETEPEARRAAFELMTTAQSTSRRGRGAPSAPRAQVTGVAIASVGVSGDYQPLVVSIPKSTTDVLE